MSLQSPQSRDSGTASGKRHSVSASKASRTRRGPMTYVRFAAGAVVLIVLGWLIWQWANDMGGVRRQVPQEPMLVPLPPPPPEPEPEEMKEPEPEPEPEEIVEPEPEPTPVEEPTPEEPPSPSDDLSEAMQIDGEAQAGADAFNIGAGSGGGMAGSGTGRVGNATYGQYLSYAFQRALREEPSIRHLSYRIQINLWLNEAGQITRVQLLNSSGDPDTDDKVIAAVRAIPALDQKPPKSMTLPVKVALQGRRPG
ncbi:energy transducer TonB [Alloalcanivorax xenomutans]|uniref:energy transducer TonB family protein n=1 Tax=Alloalcanivorax xenomutans TaxID=1094342 RepID=UPI001F08114A